MSKAGGIIGGGGSECNRVDKVKGAFYDAWFIPAGTRRRDRAAASFMYMNVPNSLTILRILLIPVYVGLLVYEQYDYALIVLFVAGLTDGLDGTIARVANQRTQLGAVLDPLADKLLLTTGFITLSVMHLIPLWVTILVVSRDLILMLGTVVAQFTDTQVDISPTILGKGTTLIQLATLVLVVFLASRRIDLSVIQPLLYVMAMVTLSSGLHYLYRGYARATAGGA